MPKHIFDTVHCEMIDKNLSENPRVYEIKDKTALKRWRFWDGLPSTRAEVLVKYSRIEVFVGNQTLAYAEIQRKCSAYIVKNPKFKHSKEEMPLEFFSIDTAMPFIKLLDEYARKEDGVDVIVPSHRKEKSISEFTAPPRTKIEENEKIDADIDRKIRDTPIGEKKDFTYHSMPRVKEESGDSNGRSDKKYYLRHQDRKENALVHAHYCCELGADHISFKRKNSGINYTETHHLIPMFMQDSFDYTLDTEENIVSLCSNCHNWIHYGDRADQLITKLYEQRRQNLMDAGIGVTLEALLSFYGYSVGEP